MVIWPDEFEAHGVHVGIVPLRLCHAPDLAEVIARGKLHQLQYAIIPEPAKIAEEIERRTRLRSEGSMQPFAVLDKRTDQVVGMTTYMNIDAKTPRLEIGSTWYCPSVQRTALNTECKLLLLSSKLIQRTLKLMRPMQKRRWPSWMPSSGKLTQN